ncbi:MAG: hypothetical protein ABI651_03340 [Verrucomicrobiota bacterium]
MLKARLNTEKDYGREGRNINRDWPAKEANQAIADARDLLQEHRDQLECIAGELLEHETIDGKTFMRLIGRGRLEAQDQNSSIAR